MANPFLEYVASLSSAYERARQLQLAEPVPSRLNEDPQAPLALLFSPHPDDEVITGLLPLRLQREASWRITNVAVTLGSKRARRSERWAELQACCRAIGFGLRGLSEEGLEAIHPAGREEQPENWARARGLVAALLRDLRPRLICLPHARDWNGTHVGTHLLVTEALANLGPEFSCTVLETEFWGAMDQPNVMVEASQDNLAELIAALSLHRGEVARNPYHLSLPAWMMDNVRRGSELVGGQGGQAPDMRFATLYRLCDWKDGQLRPRPGKGRILTLATSADQLLAP